MNLHKLLKLHKNQQGSALLLVLLTVVVVPILFGGLYLTLQQSHRTSQEHDLQVQADYQAQKMMEIALYYYYKQPKQFQAKFPGAGSCLNDPDNRDNSVCLEVANGAQTLVARGTAQNGSADKALSREHIIRVPIESLDKPTSDEPFTGDVNRENDYLIRAVMLGETFYGGYAMRGEDSVKISGGVLLGEGSSFEISREKRNDKFDIGLEVSGFVTAPEGLAWSLGEGHKDELSYQLIGSQAVEDKTEQKTPFTQHLEGLYKQVETSLQTVDVYRFRDPLVTLETKGDKKGRGYSIWKRNDETLGDIFKNRADEPKIILIEGNLLLPQKLESSGYLIVSQTDLKTDVKTAPEKATIYLPDQADWTHDGALITEQIRGYDIQRQYRYKESRRWPEQYRLHVELTREEADLYRQKK